MTNVFNLADGKSYDAPTLKGGDGGGTFDGMEPRVKRLEDDFQAIRADLTDIKVKVARMEGEVHRLPGYPGLFALCGTLVAVVALLVRFLPAPLT